MWMSPSRICGALLVAGFVVFMVGAGAWRLEYQSPDLAATLRSVAAERGRWLWIHAWMAVGVLVTVCGLTAWSQAQREAGETLATPIALVLYVVGAVLWLVAMGVRVTIQDWAAGQAMAAGVPAGYPSVHRLAGVLHAAHMVLSYASAAVLGWGVLRSGILAASVGWCGLVGGTVFAVGFAVLGRGFLGVLGAPFLAHVYTLALGVSLLRLK